VRRDRWETSTNAIPWSWGRRQQLVNAPGRGRAPTQTTGNEKGRRRDAIPRETVASWGSGDTLAPRLLSARCHRDFKNYTTFQSSCAAAAGGIAAPPRLGGDLSRAIRRHGPRLRIPLERRLPWRACCARPARSR